MSIVDRVYATDGTGSYAIADLSTAIGYMIGPIIGTVVVKYATLFWSVVGFGGAVLLLSPLVFFTRKYTSTYSTRYTEPGQRAAPVTASSTASEEVPSSFPISFTNSYNALGYGTSPLRTSRLGINRERLIRSRGTGLGDTYTSRLGDDVEQPSAEE